ncbi:MAG: fatty acid cis/trans isomerase [Halioglobus sp.]
MKYALLFWLIALSLNPSVLAADPLVTEKAHGVLQQRCMVCHGCYDAPCQLKLEAHVGLRRGANPALVYDGTRLLAANMTRLFDDAQNEAQWRGKGFFPVLDDNRPELSVMHRMLALKRDNPLPPEGALPDGFDFSLYRKQQCAKQETFDDYARDYPLQGMPYGLPGLRPDEHASLTQWLEKGAPRPDRPLLSNSLRRQITAWEAFLNGSSNKERLMARYLYEHLFLASLYLEENDKPVWFRMVRSSTPPGRNLGLISTRRPYDPPGMGTFYYRLQRMDVTTLEKSHMPYRFDSARLQWYRSLFIDTPYSVDQLPSYDPKIASNPFKSFSAIPIDSRYRFLLEEAQFTIMNFIKGPVCRGQIALNVIDDHFWIMFADPESVDPEHDANFLAKESDNLRLPFARTGTAIDLFAWRRYAKSHANYQKAKADYLMTQMSREDRAISFDSIWDGDGRNDNAALTIFRHFDTASVVKGFVGDTPKTAWVIGYSLLERIHYLLVAGFDVYGSVSHQLESRLYMDFLRMEGEFNFLMFMPPQERVALRDFWYRSAPSTATEQIFINSAIIKRDNGIVYQTSDPKREMLHQMRQKLYGAEASRYRYESLFSAEVVTALQQLENSQGDHNAFLPEVSFINVVGASQNHAMTLLRNSGYSNIAQIFREQERRLPKEDSVTLVNGFIGAYPNYFFEVHIKQLPLFAADIQSMQSKNDFAALQNRYGVRRNKPWFWRVSDTLTEKHLASDSMRTGLFDYNRYRGD